MTALYSLFDRDLLTEKRAERRARRRELLAPSSLIDRE